MSKRKSTQTRSELPVFLISGKSPVKNPGGYAAYSHNLAKVLTELGHPVFIIAQGPRAGITRAKIGYEHVVASRIVKNLSFLKSIELAALPIFAPLFTREMERIIKANRFSKFIIWGMGPWSYAGMKLKRKFGRKVKFIAFYPTTFRHEITGSYNAIRISDYGFILKLKYFLVVNIIARIYALLERQIVHSCDLITLNYKYPESFLQEEFSVSPKKFRRMSYYVEIFQREALGKPPKELKAIFENNKTLILICRQDPRKGINFLLHAFKTIRKKTKKVKLIIVGSGTMLEANRKLAKKLDISNDVIFTGFLADFGPLLKKADVFVFPAIEEGSGSLSVLEAMKLEKPIISTKCDGIPEDIVDGESGLLVPKMDSASLAKAVLKLINNPKLAKLLGRNAKKRYENKFSLELMKRDVRKILQT